MSTPADHYERKRRESRAASDRLSAARRNLAQAKAEGKPAFIILELKLELSHAKRDYELAAYTGD